MFAVDSDNTPNHAAAASPFRPSGASTGSSSATNTTPLPLQPPAPPAFGSSVRAQSVPVTNGSTPEHTKYQHTSRPREKDREEEVELTRVKPKDQVPIATFWQSVEPYFRPLTEDDRAYLEEKVWIRQNFWPISPHIFFLLLFFSRHCN